VARLDGRVRLKEDPPAALQGEPREDPPGEAQGDPAGGLGDGGIAQHHHLIPQADPVGREIDGDPGEDGPPHRQAVQVMGDLEERQIVLGQGADHLGHEVLGGRPPGLVGQPHHQLHRLPPLVPEQVPLAAEELAGVAALPHHVVVGQDEAVGGEEGA